MPSPNIPPRTHHLRVGEAPSWLTTADITHSNLSPAVPQIRRNGRRKQQAPVLRPVPITNGEPARPIGGPPTMIDSSTKPLNLLFNCHTAGHHARPHRGTPRSTTPRGAHP